MTRWIAVLALVAAFPLSAVARGEKRYESDGHVVHSRRAGVMMHRAFPPYAGVHVYESPTASARSAR